MESVLNRIFELECEMNLIDTQLESICMQNIKNSSNRNVLVFTKNIYILLHEIYINYFKSVQKYGREVGPLKYAVSVHFKAIQDVKNGESKTKAKGNEDHDRLNDILDEIKGHQQAIREETGILDDDSAENLFCSTTLFFPYEELVKFMTNTKIIPELFKLIILYNPDNNRDSIKELATIFHKEDKTLTDFKVISMAEIVIGFFSRRRMEKSITDQELANFTFSEKNRLLLKNGVTSFDIKPEVVRIISSENKGDESFDGPLQKSCQAINDDAKNRPRYDVDIENIQIKCLLHIVLELRKLTTQVSISQMTFVLWRCLNWLNDILSSFAGVVGADESFQFFVCCLVDARITIMPTLINFIEKYEINEITISKATFLRTQLRAAYDFVQTRQLHIPPYLLFPFRKTEGLNFLEMENEEQVELVGFQTFAFARWSIIPVPALIHYTGQLKDVAVMYKYKTPETKFEEIAFLSENFDSIPTLNGSIFIIGKSDFGKYPVIHLDSYNIYDLISQDVDCISNMMLMRVNTNLTKNVNVKLSSLKEYLEDFFNRWRKKITDGAVKLFALEFIKDIQNSLILMHELSENYEPNGIIDRPFIEAVKRKINFQKGDFFIDVRIYDFLTKKGKTKTQTNAQCSDGSNSAKSGDSKSKLSQLSEQSANIA